MYSGRFFSGKRCVVEVPNSAGQYQKFVKRYTFWSNITILLNITVL